MQKRLFLTFLRAEISARYAWAQDVAKLDRFVSHMRETIHGDKNLVNLDGDAVTAAWRAIGGKGKPTYKALRALPD